jgi:hypothetical protein
MRRFRLALVLSLAGASACSLLLDTDALQKGTAGTGGSAGAGGGDLDAGREGGVGCTTDLDCQPVDAVDGCMSYKCGADKTCAPPNKFVGLGVVAVGTSAENAEQAEDFGYPSLIADGTDLVLAAWKRTANNASNIVVRKYDENPQILPASADLNVITGNRFESVLSSPGIIMRNAPRRIRLFAAAKLTGAMATGMYQLDVDLATLRVSAMQPTKADLAITGYDTSARGPVPRLLPGPALGEPVGMWVQQGKLFFFDANNTGEVFGTKRVIGFAPLAANAGLHAALETTALGATDDQGETELWTRGSPALTSLINDQPGARRRGVATTATAESLTPVNFILWSFERSGTIGMFGAAASCDANQCTGVGSPAGGDGTLPATGPAAASARVSGTMNDRDLAVAYQVTVPDPTHPGTMATAILGGLTRLTIGQDGGPSIGSVVMNPATFVVGLTTLNSGNTGPVSVAMTTGGLMMIAWVERGPNMALLKTRRFQVKTCQ